MTHLRRHLAILLCFGFAFGIFALSAEDARASSPEDQIAEVVEAAELEYDMLEFDAAIGLIEAGLTVARENNVRSPEVADLHFLIGLIRHADGEDDAAIDAFVDALETHQDAELNEFYVTPSVEQLMQTARQRAQPPTDDPSPDVDDASPDIDDPPPAEDVDPLTHDPLRRADAGEPLTIEAQIPADLPVFRVHLHHRRYGESEFEQVEMDPTDATGFAVTLDGTKIRTSQFEYFITAVNRAGELVAESGRATNPHRASVIGDVHATPGDPVDHDTIDPDEPTRERDSGFYGTVLFGTDVGFLPGGTPTANFERDVSPGLAPAFAHTKIDLGWRLNESSHVGMYFRFQPFPQTDFDTLPEGAIDEDAAFFRHENECFGLGLPGDCLLGLQYQHVISSGVPQFYSSVGAGIGRVRNWIKLKERHDEDDSVSPCLGRDIHEDPNIGPYCELRDSVRTGWAHFGVGGGMFIPIIDNLDLVADSYLMILIPDTSLNLDINLGARVTF